MARLVRARFVEAVMARFGWWVKARRVMAVKDWQGELWWVKARFGSRGEDRQVAVRLGKSRQLWQGSVG
jgi:hypothetical protein